MVILVKEKMAASSRAIKVLDHDHSGPTGTANCETFVEALGLKSLFAAFMGKTKKGKSSSIASPASEDTSHVLGIVSSLFSNLPSESTSRIRLLTKFVEADFEKVDRLLEVREHAEGRLAVTENEIAQEKDELTAASEEIGPEEEDTWYLRRLDGGMFTLQTVDYILGWICMEDDGVREHVELLLTRKGKSLKDIVRILKEYRENVGDEDEAPKDDQGADAPSQKMILQGLIDFLDAC
jgi:beta-catenin-like protein 1